MPVHSAGATCLSQVSFCVKIRVVVILKTVYHIGIFLKSQDLIYDRKYGNPDKI